MSHHTYIGITIIVMVIFALTVYKKDTLYAQNYDEISGASVACEGNHCIPNIGLGGVPLGGRVLAVGASSITCDATYGPITIEPFNSAPSGPYFIRAGNYGTPRSGGYILALYHRQPDMETCHDSDGTPVPAYEITIYGTSQ